MPELNREIIENDARKRGLEPLFHDNEPADIKFENEEHQKAIVLQATPFKDWVATAYNIIIASWTTKPVFKDFDFMLEVVKNEPFATVPYEAYNLTVAVENVTRAILAQVQRHRGLVVHQFGYGELSTRNTDLRQSTIRIPQSVLDNPELAEKYKSSVASMMSVYAEMIDKYHIPFEEARMLVPLGLETYVVITGNLRVWLEYFKARKQEIAQKEHRILVDKIIAAYQQAEPEMWNLIKDKFNL